MHRTKLTIFLHFFHDPRGPTSFKLEEVSKQLLAELDRKFEEIYAKIKCIVIEQTKEIIHLKSLLTAQIDHEPKLQENLWTEKTIIPTSTLNEKNAVARTPLTNLSKSKTTDPSNNTFNPKENHAKA